MTLNEYNLKRRQAFQAYNKILSQIEKQQRDATLAYVEAVKALRKELTESLGKELTKALDKKPAESQHENKNKNKTRG